MNTASQRPTPPLQRKPSPTRPPAASNRRGEDFNFIQKQKRRRAVLMRRRIALAVFVLLAVVAAFGGKLAFDVSYGSDTFYEGVYVDGEHLNNLTHDQALQLLQLKNQQRIQQMTVKFVYGTREWTVSPEQLKVELDIEEEIEKAWLQGHDGSAFKRQADISNLRVSPYNGHTTLSYDRSALDPVLNEIKTTVDKEPVNAQLEFDTRADEKFNILKEKSGLSLDIVSLKAQAAATLDAGRGGVFTVEPDDVEPAVLASQLSEFTNRIVRTSTPLGKSSADRTFNVKRALDFFNGMTVPAGETVSFNSVTGPRGLEQGYRSATVINDGEYVEGEGGGVCQASTTLYQALVSAGIEVVERSKHSIPSSYADIGCDATVDYASGKDLVFRNNTEGPIFIQTSISSDKVYVTIYGRKLPAGHTIKMISEVLETIPAPEPEVRRDINREFCTYEDEHFDSPKSRPGYKVRTYAVTYDGDNKEVDRVKLSEDYYKEKTGVRYVGVTPLGEDMERLPPNATPRPQR